MKSREIYLCSNCRAAVGAPACASGQARCAGDTEDISCDPATGRRLKEDTVEILNFIYIESYFSFIFSLFSFLFFLRNW